MEMDKFDIAEQDLNPTVFFASQCRMQKAGEYHGHDFAEITFILSGKERYLIEGKHYDVSAGDLIICNPGVKHCSTQVYPGEPAVEFCTGFTDFQFRDMPPNSILPGDESPVLHPSREMKQEMTKHCYDMLAENDTCRPGKYFMLKAYLIQILLLIIRERMPECRPPACCHFESYHRSYAVKRIIRFLNENYAARISLDQIARNVYLSPVYISKIFKEETGESPINYLIKIRLNRARDILEQEEPGSIRDIAFSVGYEDVYHFSKLFKKYYGVSPLNYKKSIMEKKKA